MITYVLTHAWLSPIQKGIQSAHAVAELLTRPLAGNSALATEWAEYHKTLIVLDGGNSAALGDTFNTLRTMSDGFDFPIAYFREDQESLEGAMTAVGITLSGDVLDYIQSIRVDRFKNEFEAMQAHPAADPELIFLAFFMSKFHLAR